MKLSSVLGHPLKPLKRDLGRVVVASGLLLLSGGLAHADENLFGYSYGSETLPKGKWEFYNWLTGRHDKGQGSYHALDIKQELEFGITDRLQASLYLNESYHSIRNSAPFEDTDGDGQADTSELKNRRRFAFQGVQTSFKYALTSPYKDGIGIALYVEPGYARVDKVGGDSLNEYELEFKLILQKNFLEDRLVWVLNLAPEFEWEKESGSSETEGDLLFEATTGLSYRLGRRWWGGVEFRYASEYANMDINRWDHYALFAGPTLHYTKDRWWATLSFLPQIHGWPDQDQGGGPSGLNVHDHERFEWRLKVGYNF